MPATGDFATRSRLTLELSRCALTRGVTTKRNLWGVGKHGRIGAQFQRRDRAAAGLGGHLRKLRRRRGSCGHRRWTA
jgi:hypothetical protein